MTIYSCINLSCQSHVILLEVSGDLKIWRVVALLDPESLAILDPFNSIGSSICSMEYYIRYK